MTCIIIYLHTTRYHVILSHLHPTIVLYLTRHGHCVRPEGRPVTGPSRYAPHLPLHRPSLGPFCLHYLSSVHPGGTQGG